MPITHDDLGTDEDLGRRVLVRARIIAPCLDTLDPASEAGKNAIAILKGVIAELPAPGEGRVRSMSRNGTSISMQAVASAFEGDATVSLRSLCASLARGGLPVGSFPSERPIGRLWPETYT
tara:strand:- start:15 stop:377 length:363 start_codon:yes stop_codon:yes gene_type:complete